MYQFTIKLVDACNLNCSYCSYFQSVYRPDAKTKMIPLGKVDHILARIREFVDEMQLTDISILWHGGEPTLAGVARFRAIAERLEARLAGIAVLNRVGTNATLIDSAWIDFAKRHRFTFNVSIDGEEGLHDSQRRDHAGRGSFADVVRGLRLLLAEGLCYQANVVVNPAASGGEVVRFLAGLGVPSIAFQIPESDYQRTDHIGHTQAIADYLKDAFDAWFATPNLRVPMFETVVANTLGVRPPSADCRFTDHCARLMTIETDGTVHSCDVLRNAPEVYQLGTSIENGPLAEVVRSAAWQRLCSKDLTPETCLKCHLYSVCRGYCTATRYDSETGFSQPSVYCATMLDFLPHVIAKTAKIHGAYAKRYGQATVPTRPPA